jgi:hypothetical protein
MNGIIITRDGSQIKHAVRDHANRAKTRKIAEGFQIFAAERVTPFLKNSVGNAEGATIHCGIVLCLLLARSGHAHFG